MSALQDTRGRDPRGDPEREAEREAERHGEAPELEREDLDHGEVRGAGSAGAAEETAGQGAVGAVAVSQPRHEVQRVVARSEPY